MFNYRSDIDGLRALAVVPVVLFHADALLEKSRLLIQAHTHLYLIEPVGYLDMVQLEKYAKVVFTDSGGVQKEAFFHQIPCVTLSDHSPWGELVQAGWNHITDVMRPGAVAQAAQTVLHSSKQNIQPCGDGTAAQKIVKKLVENFS